MIIKTIPAGMYAANCYLVMDEETKEGMVMDPGGDSHILINAIEVLEMKPKYILLTHGHIDHVGAVLDIKEHYNIPFYINKNDEDLIQKKTEIYGHLPKADGYIDDFSEFQFGRFKVKAITTAGHTPGGVCLLIENNVFTGDTLFKGSIGRTDFIGGNYNELIDNIKNKLLSLGDEVEVYPGHGPKSSIGYERIRNPFLT